MSPLELKGRLDSANGQHEPVAPLLLDVREPREFDYCRIEGSLSIPLGQLPSRAGELPHDRDIVAICHHGARSLQAAAFLQQTRGLDVINLQGGVAAWADQVEPTMKRY
jgi:rhodanese-related sulfurtransferase